MTKSRGLRRPYGKSVAERLALNTVRVDGCLIWVAARNGAGYGVLWNGKKTQLAHRAAWELHHGKSLAGRVLRHACDTPSCVLVDHLEPGSHADNVADKVLRGRSRRKLTQDQVREIRETFVGGNGGNRKVLADKFGITPNHVWYVATQERSVLV